MVRLIAYLVGVASMGVIGQAVVGNALHEVVWPSREPPIRGETRVVTETAPGQASTRPATTVTVTGETVTRAGTPGETAPVRPTFVTVAGPTTTVTLLGPAVTTTVSGKTDTVAAPGPTVTTTVHGPTTTTTVPGPERTTTVPGPVVTTTAPGTTETVTVTVSESCDPPPKKPSNPPCPPHK